MSRRGWTLATAGLVIIFAMLALHQAGEAPDLGFDSLGSATVPYVVAFGLLVLVGLMLLEEFVLPADATPSIIPDTGRAVGETIAPPPGRWPVAWRTAVALGAFVVYVLILDLTAVPFWLATLVFIYLASRILAAGSGRGQIPSLAVSAVVAVGVHVVLTEFLLIDLP